uniref:Rab-GAP TBC domain-containing protein n=1 Tax=Ananas comosus var. bracteatus TaxID=296719 RepID=A0A6V7QS97_ANACO
MGKKKGIPEWLNSSLWSSVPSSNSHAPSFDPSPNSPRNPNSLSLFSSSHTSSSASGALASSSSPISSIGGDIAPISALSGGRSLSKKIVNLEELRRLAFYGIPDGAGIRSTVWKLLLTYLPNDCELWAGELQKRRFQYKAFKDEFLVNPSEITRRLEESSSWSNEVPQHEDGGLLQRSEISLGEHPLSLGKASVWNQFFQDSEIIEQIDRDVKRTHPDMHFFSGDSSLAKSNQESLRDILIIYAKLNPGIRYVQGMNEVLAPLLYVFRNDPDDGDPASAEADAFFCFVELLSGFRDNFCQKLDNSVVGIRSTLTKLSELLKKHDGELWRHLEVTTKVNPQFYAFRWITLLLTQEFNFADSLHIWDTLLSDPEGPQETLLRICCAMLILVRRRLLAGDFTSNLKLLQNYPSTNISHLLYVANKLRG